jgi:hypothetical protein
MMLVCYRQHSSNYDVKLVVQCFLQLMLASVMQPMLVWMLLLIVVFVSQHLNVVIMGGLHLG